MAGAGHAAYTDRFYELARMVAATKPTIIQKAGTLTDEAIRNGSLKKNSKKRGNNGETSRDRNLKDDNKRTRIRNAFATTANSVRREYTGMTPKHLAKDYRVVTRMVNLVNARNPTAARGACFECCGTDHFKATCPRLNQAQRPEGRLGAEEARQDLNIVTGIESSNLRFSYEIEMASRHLVEIDKVIRGYELEIEGHTFNIDLIPFGSRSFDVIVRMDWLSKHNAEIICHEKVVRIPLRIGKTLRVIGERPEEKIRHLRSAKTKEQKKEDIIVVRNFPEVFSDDLSGLPPN
ncbi:putative reverse transcriptase domain-containing protein [Tanacetum coccineum]